eukprot:2647848-Rhodomonas_salina.1
MPVIGHMRVPLALHHPGPRVAQHAEHADACAFQKHMCTDTHAPDVSYACASCAPPSRATRAHSSFLLPPSSFLHPPSSILHPQALLDDAATFFEAAGRILGQQHVTTRQILFSAGTLRVRSPTLGA